ncbi:MAG TPA: thiamine-phosphate kinase, partial [Myxococcaceae bacterium]|nr:thiamine-phosphate kinase [Myxococcaceae bacterium]
HARARARAAAVGGEDYELLFTAPPARAASIARLGRRLGLALTRIGEVRRGRGVHLQGAGSARLQGFDHLA